MIENSEAVRAALRRRLAALLAEARCIESLLAELESEE